MLSFIVFISTFLLLYGILHFYFYWSLKNTFILSPYINLLVISILIFLFLSPVLMILAEAISIKLINTILAYIGYLWMSFLFLFFSIHIILDLYGLIIKVCAKIVPWLQVLIPARTVSFTSAVILIILIVFYGFLEVGNIKIEKKQIQTSKLPERITNFRIVQISDIHFSSINRKKLANKIGGLVEKLKPDLLVSTGDLIERGLYDGDKINKIFNRIIVPYGKFAVTGNHEFYTGINRSTEFTEQSGFKMLRNQGIILNGFLNIVGVDDPAGNRLGETVSIQEQNLLENFPKKNFTLLLKHQPKLDGSNPYLFDLQVSGHTHRGQIFPFNIIVSLFYPYNSGLYQVGNRSYLYVSRGTGTWGPPIRFLAPPEITVIDLINPG